MPGCPGRAFACSGIAVVKSGIVRGVVRMLQFILTMESGIPK